MWILYLLTAHIFLPIFNSIEPTSTYLQTKNLVILNAFIMVNECIANIENLNFGDVLIASKNVDLKMNAIFVKTTFLDKSTVENYFPETRIRLKKKSLIKCVMVKHLLTQNINVKFKYFKAFLTNIKLL